MKISVTAVRWERILLHVEMRAEDADGSDPSWRENVTVSLAGEKGRALFPMVPDREAREADPCSLSAYINITNPGNCRCIPDGDYRLQIEAAGAAAEVTCACDPDAARRRFWYDMQTQCCCIQFLKDPFRIRVRTLRKRQNALKRLKKDLSHEAVNAYYRALRAGAKAGGKKAGRKTVLFLSEQSTAPGTNLTAVRDRMRERGLDRADCPGGGFEILESFRDRGAGRKSLPEVIRRIARADYIFVDDHVPLLDYLILDKSTVLIQLWHAGVGFKSSGYSRWGHPGCPAPFSCHRQYTYGIVSSRAVIPIFSEIWGINDEQVLATGLPRIDRFLDPQHRALAVQALEEQFPMIRQKRVITFAPTYRGRGKLDADYPYEKIDFGRLYEALGEDTVVLFRMHPWVKRPVPIPQAMTDRMADAGTVRDINDLFYVTDLLITDYSSAICEYSLMDRPMLFYAFDEKEYASSRGFHREYEAYAPGRVCRTFDELLEAIDKGDYQQEKAKRYVEEQFDFRDTGSSDRVIDRILFHS